MENVCFLSGKFLRKFRKTVYGKIFRKPFSFQNTRAALLSFSFLFLCLCLFLYLCSLPVCPATPSHPLLAQPSHLEPVSLLHPRAGLSSHPWAGLSLTLDLEMPISTAVTHPSLVSLYADLSFSFSFRFSFFFFFSLLRICGFLIAFFMVCGGLWWDCSGFLIVFFFSFYVAPNTVKYFSNYFPECTQTQEKNYFPWNHFHLQTFNNGK